MKQKNLQKKKLLYKIKRLESKRENWLEEVSMILHQKKVQLSQVKEFQMNNLLNNKNKMDGYNKMVNQLK